MPHAGARLAFVSEAPARRRRIDIPGSAPGSLHATHGSFRTEPRPLRAVHGPLHTPPRSFRTRREPCRTLPRPSHATPESHHAHMRPMRIRLDDIRRRAFAISDNYPRPQSAKPGSDRVVAVHYNFCSMGKRPHTSCRAGWDSVNTTRHSGAMTASTPSREMTTRWHGTETNPSCWSPALLPIPCGA